MESQAEINWCHQGNAWVKYMENRDIREILDGWAPPERPNDAPLDGAFVTLERLNAASHADAIHGANSQDDAIWDYLPYGPFSTTAAYSAWVQSVSAGVDPLFYAILDKERGRWAGVASYLRIAPDAGSIEVGHINFAAPLQKTRAATEAMYLMMKWVFQAGYRRYEWKCDAANLASRRAAERLGFSFEGVFRQATVVKGRNRDTAWFAMIDSEWPALERAFDTWLGAGNFDSGGQQRTRLSNLTAPIRVSADPAVR